MLRKRSVYLVEMARGSDKVETGNEALRRVLQARLKQCAEMDGGEAHPRRLPTVLCYLNIFEDDSFES